MSVFIFLLLSHVARLQLYFVFSIFVDIFDCEAEHCDLDKHLYRFNFYFVIVQVLTAVINELYI